MRRLAGAVVMVVALTGCSGGGGNGAGGGRADTTAQTCRKIDGLPRGVDNTPAAWDRIATIRRSAGGEVAALIDQVVKAGKAGDYSAVVTPAARLQALCVAAGESLA